MPGSSRRSLPVADLDHVIERVGPAWRDLRGGRVLITGGTGFIGRWMVESLLHADRALGLQARCVVLTRDRARYLESQPAIATHPRVFVAETDIRELDIPRGPCSHVLHLATDSGPGMTPLRSFHTALEGTRRVVEYAAENGVRRLLYTSSGAVYGVQPPDLARVPEDYGGAPDPTDTASGYGNGKRGAEYLCASATSAGLTEATIARCFAFVGPGLPLNANFAIGNFIRDALDGVAIEVQGDGTPRRSYLYAADLAVWLWTILIRGRAGRAYNVGSEDDISIADLAQLVADTISPGKTVRVGRPPMTEALPARYVPSTERAATDLGLRSWTPLREAIRRTAEWYVP